MKSSNINIRVDRELKEKCENNITIIDKNINPINL